MVASHHIDLWQRRSQPTFNMPNMNLNALPYDTPRTVTNPPESRGYHQTSSNFELNMPIFSHGVTSSVPYQPGAFAFDPIPVNPYNMQQAYSVGYASDIPQNVSYTRSNLVQQMSAAQESHDTFSMDRQVPKSATASPLQSSPSYNASHFGAELERSHSEPNESSSINFITDVDTLMKAIQAKQSDDPKPPQASKVR